MLMFMDKGYYDYDYEPVKEKPKKLTSEQKKIWSREKLMSVLGTAIDPATGRGVFEKPTPLTAEEMQRIAMEENEKR